MVSRKVRPSPSLYRMQLCHLPTMFVHHASDLCVTNTVVVNSNRRIRDQQDLGNNRKNCRNPVRRLQRQRAWQPRTDHVRTPQRQWPFVTWTAAGLSQSAIDSAWWPQRMIFQVKNKERKIIEQQEVIGELREAVVERSLTQQKQKAMVRLYQ